MALFLTREDVRSLLDMPRLIDAVENALVEFSFGRTIQPVRLRLMVPKYQSRIVAMPAYLDRAGVMGMKISGGAAGNAEKGLPFVMAMVVLCDAETGQFLAVMDGTYITEVRTAAASAVATRHLAHPEASVLGVLGAGVQARSHTWAMSIVRPIRTVKVYDVVIERARQYKLEMEARFGFPVNICPNAESAVRDSDIIVTVTTSKTPVVQGCWLKQGAHVNAVGAFTPDTRELDSDAVCKAKVIIADSVEALLAEAGDVLIPLSEGRISREQIRGEIGEIAAATKRGRADPSDITLFKSLGIAVEDVMTAKLVFDEAKARGFGVHMKI